MVNIVEDFKAYEDKHGLVQPSPTVGSYNGILYTAIAAIILRHHGYLNESYRYLKNIDKCQHPDHKGLFNRTPEGVGGKEGPDDYIGIAAASEPLWTDLGHKVYHYGRRHLWNYNNEYPGRFSLRSWFGRQPQVVAHISYGARRRPGPFLRAWWALSIALSALAKPTNQDAYILSWLLVRCFEANGSPSRLGRLAVRWWDKQVFKKFGPEGLRQLPYLENSPEHPITKWWRR